jgi:osmotically-inducible protein OsmY
MTNDMEIKREVLAQLDREPSVVTGTIAVEVHHGVVKLAGRVSDSASRVNAERAAGSVDGVTTVVMDVDVSGASAFPQPGGGIRAATSTI